MTDTTTTKLNAENHIFLDQPLLRLPLELQRRNFKQSQVRIDHEQKKTTELLRAAAKNAGSASAEDTIRSIDMMLARMEKLKEELSTLHEEEQALHQQSAKRIEHLQELYDIPSLTDVKYESWSRTRLDRLVVDYLLRAGYPETASSLASAKSIDHLIDLDTFISCHKVADSIQQGNTADGLRWVARNKDALKKLLEKQASDSARSSNPQPTTPNPAVTPKITTLEFELRFQEYITLLSNHPSSPTARYDAILHAQKHLYPHTPSFPAQTKIIAGLLAVDPHSPTSPYASYFSPTRWTYLATLYVDTHHALLQLPTRPLLHIALSAGLSALKTPACHSALNPASADNPSEHAKFTPSTTSSSSGIGTSLCPICSTELNALARNVPYAHHTKSSVENDPFMLPNGRVYGKERLQEAEKKNARAAGTASDRTEGYEAMDVSTKSVVDPVTGDRYRWNDLRKVYIT